LEISGIYDSGSNVSLINSKLLKQKKSNNKFHNENLVTINDVQKTNGLTKVKIKIYKIEKVVDVFIIDKQNFKYDFLTGLDIIKEFKLIQNEDLQITQKDDLNPQDKTIVEYKSIKEKTTNPGTTKPMDARENIYENKISLLNINEHVKEENFIVKRQSDL